ncbi:MAG: flavin reductase family protein [Rhodospirillaceae bacterium]|nr:flavin reductase family protein [Rhodospirillaceae bacterium]
MAPEKLDLKERQRDRAFAPSSGVAILTTCDGAGRVNAAAYGSCVRVSHEPLDIAFTAYAAHDTVANLGEVPEFTVNLPRFDPDLLARLQTVGLPFARGVNELERAGLTALAARAVRPPRVAECPRHFECRVIWTREWDGRFMVVGRVVAASVDADCVDDLGFLVWDRARPAHTCGAAYIDMFVPAFEPVAVAPNYEGPERQAYEENARRMREEG